MFYRIFLSCLLLGALLSCSTSRKDIAEIKRVLYKQQQSWNAGSIEGFMEGYWPSDSLIFIGSRGVTKGWQQTLESYKKAYPTPLKMGKLKFDIIHINRNSATSYFLMGKFTLIREKDRPSGYFVLLWRKINGKWLIVSDQTVG